MRELNFAIVDEVDSILIDEARTPLIISGPGDKSTEMYFKVNRFAARLTPEDYGVEEKAKAVYLTDEGTAKAESYFGVENLADPENIDLNHHIQQAIKAHFNMKRDVDYVVKDGEVVIVDEFTGRLMYGRRYSDGLHQAIEAKEGLKVERESKTLATITFQNFFRMYHKLSGMTGTAKTEEGEFKAIYKLDVVCVPTNLPMIRQDLNDVVYTTQKAKYAAIIEEIEKCAATGQPVLVGTVSVEKSELLSGMLKRKGIKHQVLNAKHHEREAEIVAQAGRLGAVTIATNMAGRGTDILLGGNPAMMAKHELMKDNLPQAILEEVDGFEETNDEELIEARKRFRELVAKYQVETDAEKKKVVELGGLYIIGTERHESRRIDNQLRGRAGRQGDPGKSRFFISLEDDLMRLFGSERIEGLMSSLNPDDTVPLELGLLTKQIENAQKRVEGRNFGIRKSVLEYDDVMNRQRELIYDQRRKVLEGEDVYGYIMDMGDTLLENIVTAYMGDSKDAEDCNFDGMIEYLESLFMPKDSVQFSESERMNLTKEEIIEKLKSLMRQEYHKREELNGEFHMRNLERIILLRTVDQKWRDHIDAMSQLRDGIGLRAYAQRNPIIEYQKEAFDMFDEMIAAIQEETLKMLFHVVVKTGEEEKQKQAMLKNLAVAAKASLQGGSEKPEPVTVRAASKPGRNDLCPCGSGKKYKHCCGRNEQ